MVEKNVQNKPLKVLLSELAIVAATHPNGFTVRLNDMSVPQSGYAVALIATQDSFGADGFLQAVEYAKRNNIECLGGWLDKSSGKYYFDATVIVADRKAAVELGKQNQQLAIYNLEKNRTIKLKK